jgi:phosphoglycolate phosphatase-like HAD superfamily hydrolase
LRDKGHEPWMDKRQLLPGQHWAIELRAAIDSADVILVCLSRQSLAKTGYVNKELKLILDAADLRPAGKIFIVPIRLDDCQIPDALKHVHYLDWFASDAHEHLSRSLDFEQRKSSIISDLVTATTDRSRSDTAEGITEFIQAINPEDVIRVLVITHTGSVTLDSVLSALQHSPLTSRAKLHVLLRSKELSDLGRAQAIDRSIEALRGFAATVRHVDVEARFYASPPLLRSVIVEHQDHRYSAYLSFYDWPLTRGINQRGAANKGAIRLTRIDQSNWLFDMFLSWFEHLWGKRRIHTLLFDFDDTLFLTTECQVAAWSEALQSAADGKTFALSEFAPDIRKLLERRADLTKYMTKVFLEEQQEQDILGRLFSTLPSLTKLDWLRQHRVRVREELTAQRAIPIREIIEDVRALSVDYQLAIVSATSEILVRQVLEQHKMNELFSYIIGREVPRHSWQAMENKTQQFLRISNITGVPLNRMVFVGDSEADYKSAGQLGLRFLENRTNAMRYGLKSLIKSLDPQGHPFLTGRPGELASAIREMELKIGRLP